MQNIKGPRKSNSSDKALELVAVRVGASFLGILSAHLILNGQTPTPKEFVPIYLTGFLSVYAFIKNNCKLTEFGSFAKQYPISFLANLSMPMFGFLFFLIGQAFVFSRQDLIQPIVGVFQLSDVSLFSAICGWVLVHFGTNLIYRDLTNSFLPFTIDKYLLAPADGWLMGLLVYYFSVR